MLLTITTTAPPATDLGYLLHKHPEKAQTFPVASGAAHVFYPVARDDECTAALLLDVDPIGTARGRSVRGPYVSDRPYAAGSLLAVALRAVFASAMKGRCVARPELAATEIPLRVHIPTLSCRSTPSPFQPPSCRDGAGLVERLFAPLGWTVTVHPVPLDPAFPQWGDSRYLDTTLTGTSRVADALTQLYVLLPALDAAKHYWVGDDEVDKLLRMGESWLATHPDRELITRRYLARGRGLADSALERLAEADDVEALDNALDAPRVASLAAQRRAAVCTVLRECGAHRVLDLGCGGGALLRDLVADAQFTEIVGVDVSSGALGVAARFVDRLPERARERITLRQGALTYTDTSLAGFDAAVLMEVIEHVDPDRLPALEHTVFGVARPATVVVTTPNVEYNARYEGLPPGEFRHADHRFEWTRAQFRAWAEGVAERHGYTVRCLPVGPEDASVGAPTQLAVFSS